MTTDTEDQDASMDLGEQCEQTDTRPRRDRHMLTPAAAGQKFAEGDEVEMRELDDLSETQQQTTPARTLRLGSEEAASRDISAPGGRLESRSGNSVPETAVTAPNCSQSPDFVVSPDTEGSWRSWVSACVEEAAFSFFFKALTGYLFLLHLLFAFALFARLSFAIATRAAVQEENSLWAGLALSLSLSLLLALFTSALDLNVRLIKTWLRSDRAAVHVLYLPNRCFGEKALASRNRQLGLLIVWLLIGPLVTAIVRCVVRAELGWADFAGVFLFHAFAASGLLLASVWTLFWAGSWARKAEAWRKSCGGSAEGPAWALHRLCNPICMAEFGIDLVAVRGLCVHVVLVVVCAAVVVLLAVKVSIGLVPAAASAILVTMAFAGATTATKVSRSDERTASKQQTVSYFVPTVMVVYALSGLIASLAVVGTRLFAANVLLLAACQFFSLRRHNLHVSDQYDLPESAADEDCLTRWPPLVPFPSLFRIVLPSHPLVTAPRQRLATKKARQLEATATNEHTPETERSHATRFRVLSADSRLTTALILCLGVLLAFGSVVGEGYNERFTSPVVAAPAFAPILAQNGTGGLFDVPGAGQRLPVDYAACAMRHHGVPTYQLALLVALAQHGSWADLKNDLRLLFGGAFAVDEETPGFEWSPFAEQRAWVSFTHNASGSAIVVPRGESSPVAWLRDVDPMGSTLAFQIFRTMTPLTSLWSAADQSSVISFIDTLTRFFGHSADSSLDDIMAFIHAKRTASNVIVAGHGLPMTHLQQKDELRDVSLVAFSSAGSALTAPRGYQSPHTHIVPKHSLLSLFDSYDGFVQTIDCPSNSLTQCQKASTVACELAKACTGSSSALTLC
ncbi:hypothetical protein DIPPA_20486 [Diplonema papillatum]|nr:hypothetical protein DIPPA_20486 [Diplonema papillatum]